MARGRMLNRAVTVDGKVAAYGDAFGLVALVFHHRLIAFLDKNGNAKADPYWLKGEVMPRVSGCSPEDCRRLAAGLVDHGLAELYEVDGVPYLHFSRFRENQTNLRHERERAEVPTPEGFDESSGRLPDVFRRPSGYWTEPVPPEGEVETEVEVEDAFLTETGEPDVENVGENGTTPEPPGPNAHARLMPVIREVGYLGKGPPPGYSEKRDGQIVRQLVNFGEDPSQIEAAIRGAGLARDRGEMGMKPGQRFTLRRLLKGAEDDPTYELGRFAHIWHKHEEGAPIRSDGLERVAVDTVGAA